MKTFLRCAVVALLSQSVAGEDSYAGHDDQGNYYHQFSVCDESVAIVEELSLLCDSPGAYYYGSSKYRNSASCQAGDKAKVESLVFLSEDLESDAFLTIMAKGYGTIADEYLYQDASFCDNVQAQDGQQCPEAGYYKVNGNFYFGEKNDSYQYSFKPKVSVGIASSANKNVYDLGGANTDMCAGNVFARWTKGVRKTAANSISAFFLTFGILTSAILAMFCLGWCLVRKANEPPKIALGDEMIDENEYHKISMVGKNRNLVDF